MCYENHEWPFYYKQPNGPFFQTPRQLAQRAAKSATMLKPTGKRPGQQTYLSTYRQRMAEKTNKPATFRRKQTASAKSSTTTTNTNQEGNMPTVSKTRTAKSAATKPAASKAPAKRTSRKATSKSVTLFLVKEPSGKGGFRFDNSHDRDEKLDVTTTYVSQANMTLTKPFPLALVAEPAGKGGVRFANTAKEKLDVTTMYLSQADRKYLGVTDSVSLNVVEDDEGVTVVVTP